MIRKSILLISLSFFSIYAIAECGSPSTPKLPDGAVSTLEEMLAGQKAMKAFQAEVVQYRACLVGIDEEVGDDLSAAQASIDAKLDNMKELALEADDEAKAAHQTLLAKYNAAVDSEAAIAGEFNIEIREYKAANQ
ncbi:MAG: hypothetical protein P8J18_03465 [Halieaceae bacterium]|nr:hypothetical protein [Halieaceae bacterium]